MTTRTALDLDRYHARHKRGPVTVYLTWWLAEDSGPRPCLVLVPTFPHSWERVEPCVVLLEQAWRWSEEIGDGAYAARMSYHFAKALGFDPTNVNNCFLVRGIVADHLGDLLTMPPMPGDMRESVHLGDLKVTERESGRVIERDMTGPA